MDVYPPLPRRVRLRLWIAGRRDRVGIALCDRGHYRAAERWWQLTGGWS